MKQEYRQIGFSKPEPNWNLIARTLTGEATQEEQAELRHLIRNNPEFRLYLQVLTDFWNRPCHDNGLQTTIDFNRLMKNDFSATGDSRYKPDASFYFPGKNSIAINYSSTHWEDMRLGAFEDDVAAAN